MRSKKPFFMTIERLMGLVAVLLLLGSSPAMALRCGNDLVDIGDRKHKVLRICGDPAYVDEFEQPVTYLGFTQGYNRIEVWTYNFGRNRFMRELVFQNGVLHQINQLEHGY